MCRVVDERGLEGYDERLLAAWRGESRSRKGYRTLARELNVTLLRREMDVVGLPTLGDEAASKYDRLRGEDATAEEVARVLEREGIDVEALREDFVSYGVVRTHIRECLGAEYDPAPSGGWEGDAVAVARERAAGTAAEAASAAAGRGDLAAGGDLVVHVDVEVECTACRARVDLDRALRRGRVCRCDDDGTGASDGPRGSGVGDPDDPGVRTVSVADPGDDD